MKLVWAWPPPHNRCSMAQPCHETRIRPDRRKASPMKDGEPIFYSISWNGGSALHQFNKILQQLQTNFLAFFRVKLRGENIVRSEEHTSELQSRQYLVCR